MNSIKSWPDYRKCQYCIGLKFDAVDSSAHLPRHLLYGKRKATGSQTYLVLLYAPTTANCSIGAGGGGIFSVHTKEAVRIVEELDAFNTIPIIRKAIGLHETAHVVSLADAT
jgi:hypothetical protein